MQELHPHTLLLPTSHDMEPESSAASLSAGLEPEHALAQDGLGG